MTKPTINQLGAVGLMLDGDPTMLPDQAFTDCLNVRFNGREIEPYEGNYVEGFYTRNADGDHVPSPGNYFIQAQAMIFDSMSNGARILLYLEQNDESTASDGTVTPAHMSFLGQNMDEPALVLYTATADIDPQAWAVSGNAWNCYKGQINNCAFFGVLDQQPAGKAYNWTGYDLLPGWGEQTTGNDGTTSTIVQRKWTCRKLVSFDNRLIMLNTKEEDSGGVQVPYPNRLRWSGFAQENAFPINWDDTAGNRTTADYAAAVIDGYAGWEDITTSTQIIDACENGGALYVYTERETFMLTPTGSDTAPFNVKNIYTDLGALDLGCVVNCHGYNYVFTGSDVVRHDSVSWKSVADGYVRDYLSELAQSSDIGKVRMVGYPELSEVWVMIPGTQQADGDYGKSLALTFNYVKGTWSKKTLPYITDAPFLPVAPNSKILPVQWDENATEWDMETNVWDTGTKKTAQGVLCGCCINGGIYVLNGGTTEARWTYGTGGYSMQVQPLQRYIERRGLDFNTGYRSVVTQTYLNGKGTNDVNIRVGAADNPDSGYAWDSQTINMTTNRRSTWRVNGESHGYHLETSGGGDIPVGITFTVKSAGQGR